MLLRRDRLIERIKEYLPDPNDERTLEVLRLSSELELHKTLQRCRKRASLAVDLKRALAKRKAAEEAALIAARKPSAQLKRAAVRAVNAISKAFRRGEH